MEKIMKQSRASKIIAGAMGVIMTMLVPLGAQAGTEDWRIAGYTRYRDAVFADSSRISSPAADVRTIWIRIAPSGKSRYLLMVNEYLASVNKSQKGFKSFEILCEINCSRQLIRFARFVYFDDTGKIIHEADDEKAGWLGIQTGDIWDKVQKEACGAGK
ncbi:MAG TPA: hypothetical protein PKZ12_02175 [Smithellaceae bacterium]|nr:hypothetical protein [Smithellaceae bacterium]